MNSSQIIDNRKITQTIGPITYKLVKKQNKFQNEIDNMIDDLNSRYQIFNTFSVLWQQRVKLEFQYAERLRVISNSCLVNSIVGFNKINKSNRPSELFLTTLVNIIAEQSTNHGKLAEQLNQEVLKRLKEEVLSLETENKKNITLAKSLKKDFQTQFQLVQKNKQKYQKKCSEMQKLQIEYVNSTLLQDRDFQRKNRLFLKIKQLQNQVSPLKKTYESTSSKYSDILATSTTKFNQLFSKIQQKQLFTIKYMKNCLINSQLFHSALGAILVHETQSILSYLDIIPVEESQIQIHTFEELEQQKQGYANSFNNPSQYIEVLFKNIKQGAIEEIVNYGVIFQVFKKNPEYKKQLSRYFENSHGFDDFKSLKVISDYTVRIIEIFKSVFQGTQYSQSTLVEFSWLIKTKSSLRKDFIFCLQKYRLDGKFKIHKQNLDNIIHLLKIFLDVCMSQLDTYNAKQFMVLSFTYYFIDENKQKIDLQFYVKEHVIWKNLKWWQSSLLESIYEEHKVKQKKVQANLTFSLWDIKNSSLRKILIGEENSTIVNICFNQLAYYLHNMQLFDLLHSDINDLAKKYIRIYGFSTKMAQDLLKMSMNSKDSISFEKTQKNN